MDTLIFIGMALLYLGLLLFKAVSAWVAVRTHAAVKQSRPPLAAGWMSDVSILQPILSGDPQLAHVLEDNLKALAQAHFFWLIDDNDATAHELAAVLLRQYPSHQIHLMSCPQAPDGINPKSFKLNAALADVTTGICLVLDDDARLSAASLETLVGTLAEGELVTALPCYREGHTLGARLLDQFVNNNAALTYLPLLPFSNPVSINGMCYALRTRTLVTLGGFSPILTHLADDLAMARLLRANGARLVQSSASVEVQTSTPTLVRYRQQMHRWFLFATLLLRTQSHRMTACITLLQGIHPLLLWGLVLGALRQPSVITGLWLSVVLLIRCGVLCWLQSTLSGKVRHRPWLSVLSELLQPLHLLHASVDRTIMWRTRVYLVRDNDDFSSV